MPICEVPTWQAVCEKAKVVLNRFCVIGVGLLSKQHRPADRTSRQKTVLPRSDFVTEAHYRGVATRRAEDFSAFYRTA